MRLFRGWRTWWRFRRGGDGLETGGLGNDLRAFRRGDAADGHGRRTGHAGSGHPPGTGTDSPLGRPSRRSRSAEAPQRRALELSPGMVSEQFSLGAALALRLQERADEALAEAQKEGCKQATETAPWPPCTAPCVRSQTSRFRLLRAEGKEWAIQIAVARAASLYCDPRPTTKPETLRRVMANATRDSAINAPAIHRSSTIAHPRGAPMNAVTSPK